MTTDSSSSAGIPIGSSVSSVHVQHHDLIVSCWPIRDSMASRLVLAAVVVSTAIVAWWTQQLVVPIVMGLLLFCCLIRLWLPSRFEIGPIGITRIFLGRRQDFFHPFISALVNIGPAQLGPLLKCIAIAQVRHHELAAAAG